MINLETHFEIEKFQVNHDNLNAICGLVLREYSSFKNAIISIVFSNNNHLNELKIHHFGEDVLTDVITFVYEKEIEKIELEIYISVEMARENAKENNVSLDNEIKRLVVHGILHAIDYDDQDPENQRVMYQLQEKIIEKFNEKIIDE